MREQLRRDIRKWDLLALALNCIIGAGIFGLPSPAYALAGSYSILAWVVCAIPTLLIVLCFAEVSSRFNETGGLYLYARTAFGSIVGFEIGWLAWLARVTGFAALCNLFADYLTLFLPSVESGPWRVAAIAVVVSVLTGANFIGVRQASFLNNVFTIGKLVPLLLLVGFGAFFIDPSNFSSGPPAGYSGFSTAVLLLVFAFTGFEIPGIPAGESQDPRRHLPFALLTGTLFAVVLYVAIQAVCIGLLPDLANSQRPLADAGFELFGWPGAAVISLGALISVTGTMNAIMLSAPRLLFAMAEQGQLPRMVSATHQRFRTPYVAILFSAVTVLVLTLSGTFVSAATLSTIIRLTTYAVTCAALPILRRKAGSETALFVVRGGGIVAITALILIAWLFSNTTWLEAGRTLLAGGIGLVLYASWRLRNVLQSRPS